MNFEFTLETARQLDHQDKLSDYRNRFHIPTKDGKEIIYFLGNSLGLQPKNSIDLIKEELSSWAKSGVDGYFSSNRPWLHYQKLLKEPMAKLVGALPIEVTMMNSLTTNLHLLLVSFYQPTGQRYKILAEAGAFPSDQYVMESQVRFHGYDPNDTIIEVKPREGESTLRTGDIISAIEYHKDELALILFGGVQYFTGQLFDIKEITSAGHDAGAKVGFDLAHAVGNVSLQLHDWRVDFAAWCTYKYLNSGPGSVGGVFIHEKYADNRNLPRFSGWWGYKEDDRFKMKKGFVPMPGSDGWQQSNLNILSGAALLNSLNIFQEVGFAELYTKSKLLTAFTEFVINQIINDTNIEAKIITPTNLEERGCQLSLMVGNKGRLIFDQLIRNGIEVDWRENNLSNDQSGVIRLAPVPLYNTFEEVFDLGIVLKNAIVEN